MGAARRLSTAAGGHALRVDVDRRRVAATVGNCGGRQHENGASEDGGYQDPVQPPEHGRYCSWPLPLASVKTEQIAVARDAAVGIGVAAAIFALSYADGGFAPTTRSYAGIAAWWLLGAGAAVGIAGARAGIDRFALAAVGLLAAFAVWILISVNWATDAARAFAQFNQVSLYVAVLAIAIVLARLVPASWVVGGVALALSSIATVALVSRCFPSTFGLQPGRSILPSLVPRLSFPLGYWNGLGIEVSLAYPLLLAIMTSRRSQVASALAALPLPIFAAVMYLTSSRGAFVAAAVGVVAYVVLTPRRWAAAAAIAVAGAAGTVSVAALVHKKALVNGAMNTALGVQQGHRAGLLIGIACVVTALAWLGLGELGRRLPTPPRIVGVVVVIAVVGLVLVAIVASHPLAKFDQSKNNSRTWFDTAACANALNLRAYRERRKAARFSDLSERDPG